MLAPSLWVLTNQATKWRKVVLKELVKFSAKQRNVFTVHATQTFEIR